jgi:cellulose biosynthesis protein BcsQ
MSRAAGGVTSLALATIKGGEGKTTSTISLGAAFVLTPPDNLGAVVLIDCDPQGSLSEYLGLVPADDLAAVLLGKEHIKHCIVPVPNYEKLYVLRGWEQTYEIEELFIRREAESGDSLADRLHSVVTMLEKLVPQKRILVFLDTAPSRNKLQEAALSVVDYVLCPAQLEFGGETGIGKVQQWLADIDAGHKFLGVIPQRVQLDRNEHRRTLVTMKRVLGERLVCPPIREAEEVAEAIRQGVPIWSYADPGSEIIEDYKHLFERLASDLGFEAAKGSAK